MSTATALPQRNGHKPAPSRRAASPTVDDCLLAAVDDLEMWAGMFRCAVQDHGLIPPDAIRLTARVQEMARAIPLVMDEFKV